MNVAKEVQLIKLMVRVCRGARVGSDLELVEVAARRERALLNELARIEAQEPQPAGANQTSELAAA